MSKSIRDVEEFCKLFRIRIPVESEFDYYIYTLSKSPEYRWLPDRVADFGHFEHRIKPQSVGSFKMEQLAGMRKSLEETEVYEAFKSYEFEKAGERKNLLSAHDRRFLVSVDIEQAGFSIFKAFDKEGELPNSWMNLCEEMEIDPILATSVAWRQMLFGKIIPKHNQRLQHLYMKAFVDLLKPLGLQEEQVLTLGPNEATLVLGRDEEEAARTLQAVSLIAEMVSGEDCSDKIPEPLQGALDLNVRPFRLTSLRPGSFLKEHFKFNGEYMRPTYRSLYGVPGNQYFLNFKEKVLRGRLDERDLLFMTERRLARWMI